MKDDSCSKVRHNADIMLGEMRASLEAEKQRTVEDVSCFRFLSSNQHLPFIFFHPINVTLTTSSIRFLSPNQSLPLNSVEISHWSSIMYNLRVADSSPSWCQSDGRQTSTRERNDGQTDGNKKSGRVGETGGHQGGTFGPLRLLHIFHYRNYLLLIYFLKPV